VLGVNVVIGATHLLNALPDSAIKKTDTIPKKQEPSGPIKSKVKYTANDSMRFDVKNQKMYLFGNAEVIYENLNLKAGYIELNMKDNSVFAEGRKDSSGKMIELPKFKQGDQTFSSKKMTYNFHTKKGKIIEVDTKEGEGYVHGETIKKDTNAAYYIKNGRYTTCDNPDPHFYISARRLKVIPDDKIITGPANLVICGIPTPLAVPFGFFPNKTGQKSGIIIPTYGQSATQGYFLKGGGYYFGISDHLDMALKGDIYSYGSWALNDVTNYNKRYRYTGNINIGYSHIFDGDPEIPSTKISKDFFIKWSHIQDPKAHPSWRFSANVNAGSSSYNQLNSTSPSQYLTNTFQSNISYSKSFIGTPFNLSANATHSQNTITKEVDISLPVVTLTMNRIYPFKNSSDVVPRWYDKIGVSYTGMAQNKISTFDSLLFKQSTLSKLQNGVSHSIPISVPLNVLKYFTLTPSLSLNSRWYFQTTEKKYNPDTKQIVTDTVQGFKMANDYSFSTALATNVYGNYFFRKSKIKQIRHVLTPNISYTYRPDYSLNKYGYYKSVKDSNGNAQQYSIFQNGIYGTPGGGKSSLVNISLTNNLEMKVRQKTDSGEIDKKVVLLESFGIASSYNMAADSLKWSNIGLNARTKLFKTLDVNYTGALDPYVRSAGDVTRLNKFEWTENRKIGRLSSSNLSLGTAFKSHAKDAKKEKDSHKKDNGYSDFKIPWTLNVAYNISYTEPGYNVNKTVTQSLTFGGDLTLTPKWKINTTSGYDFITNKLTYTSVTVIRDLHCWEMKFNVIPFGPNQRYTLDIYVKASVLKDLKISKHGSANGLINN